MSYWYIKNNSTGREETFSGGKELTYEFPLNNTYNDITYTVKYVSDNGIRSNAETITIGSCKCDYKVKVLKNGTTAFAGLKVSWKDNNNVDRGISYTNNSGIATMTVTDLSVNSLIPTPLDDAYDFEVMEGKSQAYCDVDAEYKAIAKPVSTVIPSGRIKVNWQWNGSYIWGGNIAYFHIYHREFPNTNLVPDSMKYVGLINCPCGDHACEDNNKASIVTFLNEKIDLGILNYPLSEYFVVIERPDYIPPGNAIYGRYVKCPSGNIEPFYCINKTASSIWDGNASHTSTNSNYIIRTTLDKLLSNPQNAVTIRAFDSIEHVPDYC